MKLNTLETPVLILDELKFEANLKKNDGFD